MDDIDSARASRVSHGAIIIDGNQVADTCQCAHCNKHWIVVKGSGIRRGFCLCCMQVTCGARACDVCVPFEKRLDEYERGKRTTLFGP